MLREARERLDIDLAEVHDRTGISWRNLEALESGEVQRFSEPSAAAVAMRRYADLVSLDPQPLIAAINNAPVHAYSGAPPKGAQVHRAGRSPEARPAKHLRRYDDDHSHLRSFTQTAEVPVVGGGPAGPSPAGLFGYPSGYDPRRYRRNAPWALRFLTWLVVFLIVVGGAGLSIDHYEPQWLRDIHIIRTAPPKPTAQSHLTLTPDTTAPTTPTTSPPAVVTTTKTGNGNVSVKVPASIYTVVIDTTGACWIQAQTPLNVNPVFNRTLLAGQTASIPVNGGQLSVELGSLAAQITIQVGGQTLQGWSLKPDAVPYFVTFSGS
jgi:Helix-turn-helix domain